MRRFISFIENDKLFVCRSPPPSLGPKIEIYEILKKIFFLLQNKSYVLLGRNQKDCECSSLYLYLKKENKLKLIKRINRGWDYEKNEMYLNNS